MALDLQLQVRLPPELTDQIIDHCHSDKLTLFTCGLVCKSWYPASRFHLFTAVEISSEREREEGFSSLIRPSEISSVTIIPFLQELSLHLRSNDKAWLHTFASSLPEYIPIRTLRIFCHGILLSNEVKDRFSNTFRSITDLSVFESTLVRRPLADDVGFICSFEQLESVLLYGHHRHELCLDADVLRLPKGVRALKLDLPTTATEAFMHWLLAHDVVPVVSVLRVFRVTEDRIPAFRDYLYACRKTLKEFMLFLYQCRTDPSDFDLSEHTQLNNLYLNCNGSSTFTTIHSILSSALSNCHQFENVLLRISSFELRNATDWVPLNELLAQVDWKVTVVVDQFSSYEDTVKERLPGCTRLNFVRIGEDSIASIYVSEVYERMKKF